MKQLSIQCLFLLVSFFTYSQQIDIIVVDSASNEPLPYVSIYLKKSGIGTTSNLNGEAQIDITQPAITQDTLVCSYISYKKELIPVDLSQSQRINIQLKPEFQNIDGITVVASSKKSLTAKQILKKALKNTSKNYANSPINLLGLYRETFKEDNEAIYLNEAAIKIHYNKYPQGKFQRRDWQDWYNDDSYAFEFKYSQFDGFPNQFNSKGDRVQLIEARSTENQSKYGFGGSIVGGPLSMTSKDYPKYQSDFLDSKNFNKYAYVKTGIENMNGVTCYVIHFYPLESGRKMSISFGKKLNRSIYVGKMYVDRSSFAVVKMEFQLAQNVDFGYYQKFVPLDYRVEIDYKKHDEIWALDKLKLTQLRSYKMFTADHKVLYESEQEIFFSDVITDSVAQIPLDLEWRHTRITTLRDREVPYNSAFWANYENQVYPPLPNSVKNELTTEKTLEEQFTNRFKQNENIPAPVASKTDYEFHYPNDSLQDDYQWFFDADRSIEFYQYLESENEYADNYIISCRNHQKNFFNSINHFYPEKEPKEPQTYRKGQIVLIEDSLDNSIYYEYHSASERSPILNLTEFKANRQNCYVQRIKFAKNKIGIQYTSNGGLNNRLIILDKGNISIEDSLSDIYTYEWLNDSTLFYTQENSMKRSDKLYSRNVSKNSSTLIKTESDLTYDISLSQSKTFIYCIIESKNESEIYALNKNTPKAEFECIIERRQNIYNSIKEFNGSIYALTNEQALNNRILKYENQEWTEIVPHDKNRLINDFVITENYIGLNTFNNSFSEIVYKSQSERKWTTLELPSEINSSSIYRLKNDLIHITYSSPKEPFTVFYLNLQSNNLTKIETTDIKRRFQYEPRYIRTKRLFAKASDGTKIPITISYSVAPKKTHKGLILKAYGSYGAFPGGTRFSPEDVILMKDGFSIAYAHVRGERIMGNQWYEDGKLMNKENTFNDYIACAEYLIKKDYTDPEHLVGYGISAGGLVMGVAINRRPELFNTVILDHAYLDALTTMMNDTLPLTTDHYKEVGNPQEPAFYDLMKGYSPYQNISKQDYPNLLFISGSNDFQTPTWQIAKCVAKLREMNTGDTEILFKTDMGSGHMGNTQGDQWMRDLSFMHAFIYGNLFKN